MSAFVVLVGSEGKEDKYFGISAVFSVDQLPSVVALHPELIAVEPPAAGY